MIRPVAALALSAAVALSAAAQDAPKEPTASELLRKVESTYAAYKTLKLKTKLALSKGEKKGEATVEMCMKSGDRVRFVLRGEIDGRELDLVLVCDGKQLKAEDRSRGGDPQLLDVPKDFGTGMLSILARGGSFLPFMAMRLLGGGEETPIAEWIVTGDEEFGKDEKIGERACRVVDYQLNLIREEEPATMRLWVDKETNRVVKRELTSPRGESIVETFESFEPDVEIADGDFKVDGK